MKGIIKYIVAIDIELILNILSARGANSIRSIGRSTDNVYKIDSKLNIYVCKTTRFPNLNFFNKE